MQWRFETTPVQRGGYLYVATPFGRIVSLDAETGEQKWVFDAVVDRGTNPLEGFTTRGVALFGEPSSPSHEPCTAIVFIATVDARLLAADASSGQPCKSFGSEGEVDLAIAAGIANTNVSRADISVTSPPTVFRDVVIVGSTIRESNGDSHAPSGIVRAFDVRTGVLRWSFSPLLLPMQSRAAIQGGNVWGLISTDEARDLVFLPTASATPDFFGGDRPGTNEFANSVIAVRGTTGARVWAFQAVHHDLWDYDVAAEPLLVDLTVQDRVVPAVIVGTKSGMIFVLDRETGAPVFPIEERPVPGSKVPRENPSSTQPFPTHPALALFGPLSPDSAFGVDQSDHAFCARELERLHYSGMFTPPSTEETLQWPGFLGGINWDGLAWDPSRQRLFVSVKRVATTVRLIATDGRVGNDEPAAQPGQEVLEQRGSPFRAVRRPLVAPSGTPCSPPPWTALLALQLGDRPSLLWSQPVGAVPWLRKHAGYRTWGSIAFGGPLVTGGGLVILGASQDDKIHAFDSDSGELLWESALPAGGQSSPMTYIVRGKQYLVVGAGGRNGIGTAGDWIVAFSLGR